MAKGTINKVTLIGRVGKDPELRYTPGGTAVVNFSLATTETWKNKEGENQDSTTWHKIVAWGKLAEIIGEYVVKGSHVYVDGRLKVETWTPDDGVKRYITKVIASQMQILNRVERDYSDPAVEEGKGGKQIAVRKDDEDSVPF